MSIRALNMSDFMYLARMSHSFGEKWNKEKTVSLYIKFNKLDGCFVIVISFHEQKYPLTYYFR